MLTWGAPSQVLRSGGHVPSTEEWGAGSVRWNDFRQEVRSPSHHPPLFLFFGWENSAVRLVVYDGFKADGYDVGMSLVTWV